jgi:hypothetical protein
LIGHIAIKIAFTKQVEVTMCVDEHDGPFQSETKKIYEMWLFMRVLV